MMIRYDLELHMVHVSPQPDGKNKTAVVGLLYKYGSPDPFLSKVRTWKYYNYEHKKNKGGKEPKEKHLHGLVWY